MPSPSFNTGNPIAYFLTWTTYGTWLPGDERGWNRKGDFEYLPANQLANEAATSKLKETPLVLDISARQIVDKVIRKHCEIRSWKLYAVNVRSNHVHVVVDSPGYLPETVASQFKAWCTRKLSLRFRNRSRFWTQGTSCRWINQEDDLLAAVEYTSELQD